MLSLLALAHLCNDGVADNSGRVGLSFEKYGPTASSICSRYVQMFSQINQQPAQIQKTMIHIPCKPACSFPVRKSADDIGPCNLIKKNMPLNAIRTGP
jgi:hypothetical protein